MKQEDISIAEVLQKMYRYCAYRERSRKEVEAKLMEYGLPSVRYKKALEQLHAARYIDDERFARAFVRGKFGIKRWGKIKIAQQLAAHNLDSDCVKAALSDINQEDYCAVLNRIIRKKGGQLLAQGHENSRAKTARYAIQKGYESDLVWRAVHDFFALPPRV